MGNYWWLPTPATPDDGCTSSTLISHMIVQIQIHWKYSAFLQAILLQVIQCTLYSTAGHIKQLSIFTVTEALIYIVPNNALLKPILKVSDDDAVHVAFLAFRTS
jgi:hypothetical protein